MEEVEKLLAEPTDEPENIKKPTLQRGVAEQSEAGGIGEERGEIPPPLTRSPSLYKGGTIPQSRASSRQPPLQGGLEEREPIKAHIENLVEQGRRFRQSMPEFDLRKELNDPMFARLTSPLVGLSVEDAYYALHRRQMQQQAARITAAGLSRSIQAGRLRPEENHSQAASLNSFNYGAASKQQREELKKEIRHAAAMGKKIYP